MSNLMSGDNRGAEPDEHWRMCRVNCPYADRELSEGEECPNGHDDHECSCESAAEDYWQSMADAEVYRYETFGL